MLLQAEKFAAISFYSIPVGRWPDLFFYDDAQSMDGVSFPQRIKNEILRRDSPPKLHPFLEILRPGYPFLFRKP